MADTSFAAFKRNVLVLFAHPSPGRSEVNGPMARAAAGIDGVTLVDLYAEYPDFRIDVDREQKRLLDHDVIVFQHPLYWYSTTAILKEWQDLVLEHGFAYGSEGTALQGKIDAEATARGDADTQLGQRIDNLLREPALNKLLQKQDYSRSVEIVSPLREGEWLNCRVVPYGADQKLLLLRDVTERIRLNRMRRDFVGNASHELRSPLTVPGLGQQPPPETGILTGSAEVPYVSITGGSVNAAETLRIIAADPKHLGARIGATLVLHTWGSAMTHHPHVHGIVPGGGLSPDGQQWVAWIT